jgi:uncharacterized membrane protein
MKAITKALKSINYRLFLAILLLMLFPTIYQTVRIFFLGAMPNDWGFNIASQLSWVSLFYEIIQEALILPLFFVLGQIIIKQKRIYQQNKRRTSFNRYNIFHFIVCIVYFCRTSCHIYGAG